GFSPVPSSDRAAASIPATEPMSEPPVLGEGGDITGDGNGRVLADRSLVGVHIEQTGAVGRLHGRLGGVRSRTGDQLDPSETGACRTERGGREECASLHPPLTSARM